MNFSFAGNVINIQHVLVIDQGKISQFKVFSKPLSLQLSGKENNNNIESYPWMTSFKHELHFDAQSTFTDYNNFTCWPNFCDFVHGR